MREIGGAFLIHAPVQRIHHARHAGADDAVPVNVAAVPRAVHKAGIYRLRHLPERKGCGVCRQALFEFGGPELNVIMAKTPDDFIERSMDELLPFGFGPSNVAGNKAVEE